MSKSQKRKLNKLEVRSRNRNDAHPFVFVVVWFAMISWFLFFFVLVPLKIRWGKHYSIRKLFSCYIWKNENRENRKFPSTTQAVSFFAFCLYFRPEQPLFVLGGEAEIFIAGKNHGDAWVSNLFTDVAIVLWLGWIGNLIYTDDFLIILVVESTRSQMMLILFYSHHTRSVGYVSNYPEPAALSILVEFFCLATAPLVSWVPSFFRLRPSKRNPTRLAKFLSQVLAFHPRMRLLNVGVKEMEVNWRASKQNRRNLWMASCNPKVYRIAAWIIRVCFLGIFKFQPTTTMLRLTPAVEMRL